MSETRDRVMALLVRDCPIAAAWRAKGMRIKCMYFGVGDNCGSCSYVWPELAQEILDEVITDGQGIESYRRRARSARARARHLDEACGAILRSMRDAFGGWIENYRLAGGTMELENGSGHEVAGELSDSQKIPEGAEGARSNERSGGSE